MKEHKDSVGPARVRGLLLDVIGQLVVVYRVAPWRHKDAVGPVKVRVFELDRNSTTILSSAVGCTKSARRLSIFPCQ